MDFLFVRRTGRQFLVFSFCVALLAPALPGQVHHRKTAPRRAVHRSARPSPAGQVRYTGVWEPMNYPDDIAIKEVYFVTPDVGWIAAKGKGGVLLLHTSDGGRNWDAQLGDVQGSDEEFSHLQFIDQLHGWAVQKEGKLLRTTDGKNWEQAGTLPKFHPLSTVKFTSVRNGVFVGGYANQVSIFNTHDGGRNWKEVFKCATRITVNGLARNVGCHLMAAHFPSAKVGYAVGGGYNGGYMVVAKTEDGGASWRLVFSTSELETAKSVFFTSESNGFIVTRDKKLYSTSDGGRTWRGVVATVDAEAPVLFTDPEVAWTCWRQTCSFSTDSGRHWNSREFRFPAYINAFSVPRRDRIYVAGDHGMIYRYRMLPASRVTKAMLPAPAMPGYGSLNGNLQRIRTRIDALRTKLAEAGAPVSPATSSAQDDAAGSAAGANSQGFDNSADADAGFNQDTSFSGSFDAGTPAPDVPASDAIQNCCAAQIRGLQTDVNLFNQQAPAFAGKFRNLNLLVIGLNMFSDIVGRAHGLRDSLLALKKAPDLQTAAAALQDLVAKLDSTKQSISSGFSDLATNGSGGAFDAGNGAGNTFSSEPLPSGSESQGASSSNDASSQPAQQKESGESTKEKMKKELKKRFHFPH
jgi:photosystem II stability/assembly factor-like uncharacterized protein